MFNDDTSAIVAGMNFDPVRVGLIYSRLGSDNTTGSGSTATGTNQHDDTNLWGFDVDYRMEGMRVIFSLGYFEGPSGAPAFTQDATATVDNGKDFELYVLAVDVDYKMDMFSAYLTAAYDGGSDDGLDTDGDGNVDDVPPRLRK